MTGRPQIGLALLSALRDASPWLTDPTDTLEACGIAWDGNDILRFLGKCRWHPHPTRPDHFCLIYTGAKSKGGRAKKPDKRGRMAGGNLQYYGSFTVKGKTVRAHKFFAIAVLGLRPGPDEELDHECHVTLCVSDVRCIHRDENRARIRRRKAERTATNGVNHTTIKGAGMLRRALAKLQPQIKKDIKRAVSEFVNNAQISP